MKPSETDVDVEPTGEMETGAIEEWGATERALFRSGREEAPAATRAAVLGALGLADGPGPSGGPDGGTTGRAARPSSPAPSMLGEPARSKAAQWVVGGLLAAALPGAWLLSPSGAEPVPVAAQAASLAAAPREASATREDAPLLDAPRAPNDEIRAAQGDDAGTEDARAVAPQSPAPTSPKSAAPASKDARPAASSGATSTLPEELSMIRKARSALAEGRGVEALATLDEYSSRFARPQLGHEAAMVRIEALVKSGRREEARRVAAPLIASGSVHAARARSLVEGSH